MYNGPMALNHRQFWHVAPRSARQSIDRQGIDYSMGTAKWEQDAFGSGPEYDEANYVFNSVTEARIYQKMANTMSKSDDGAAGWLDNSGQTYDVYEINVPKRSGLRFKKDPLLDNARVTKSPIPRRFVRRVP